MSRGRMLTKPKQRFKLKKCKIEKKRIENLMKILEIQVQSCNCRCEWMNHVLEGLTMPALASSSILAM
jgi:hypothetical protein